ncbi:disulfide bond formation protein B [Nocardia arthritidis]|uniref:disulfide bond formation protein B n=1 Tax=Nocardia arthritidis TaxID=228602 RepID=UPI0019315909|nr:disulfide bond formation protein B [Nocardia arthritidis]
MSEQATARPLGRVQYWLAWIFVIGWTGVVCGGLGVQFIAWDYPCPLCLVQRMFMLLAALGGAYIVRRAMTSTVTPHDYATGWGLAIVACAAGGFASWRQTMLHILPGDPGYGGPVLGLHLYVWALILFAAAIVAAGAAMAFANETAAQDFPKQPYTRLGMIAIGFLGVVIAINLVAVFLLAGFHWFLPDNPDRYQFFYDVHILS